MPDVASLTFAEQFWLGALILLFVGDFLNFASQRDPLAVYQPPVFVMAFMSYYCIVGPVQRLLNNEWTHVTVNFRYAAVFSWAGATVFYLAVRLGYGLFSSWTPNRRFVPGFDQILAMRIGARLCWAAMAIFAVANGPRVIAYLNPFNVAGSSFIFSGGLDLGPFANYANQAVNLLIPGTLLQFAGWVRSRQRFLPSLLWTLASMAIFTSLGFRWRIVTLLVPMVLLWFLARGRRPAPAVIAASAFGLVLLSGLIEQTRSYGIGLSLDAASDASTSSFLSTGLNESSVFLVTGGVIENTPSGSPFVGLQPLISALLFPVPRALWQDKNSFEYLVNALSDLFGTTLLAQGQAILNYGEYFLMFGWPSLVLMGLLSGWLLRTLWNWFSVRRSETLAQVTYLCTCSLLYMWVSRGYLPQVALIFAFGSLPLFWFYYRTAR